MIFFGVYNNIITNLKLNEIVTLDGNDGFEDQSLWGFKKNDVINFILKDDTLIENPFEKDLFSGKFLRNNDNEDFAKVLICRIQKLNTVFELKKINENDQDIILTNYKKKWTTLYQRKLKSENRGINYNYKSFDSELLSVDNFTNLKKNGELFINRNCKFYIYPKLLKDKEVRVLSVGGNWPTSSCIYDIVDIDKFFTKIENFAAQAEWVEESSWWLNHLS